MRRVLVVMAVAAAAVAGVGGVAAASPPIDPPAVTVDSPNQQICVGTSPQASGNLWHAYCLSYRL